MKKILFFILTIISIQSFGQPAGYQKRIVNERIQGSFMVDTAFNIPRYYDTTAANLHKRSDTCGAMFFSYGIDSIYYRACNPKRWISLGSGSSGGGGGGLDSNISNSNLTAISSNTYDLNGFTQTYIGGKEIHDSLTFTNTIIPPTPDSLISYGNSITVGQNASPTDSAYIYRYKNLLGLVLDNKAVSGRGAWRATSEANLAEFPGHTKMAAIMAGFNDVRRGGSDARTFNKVINAHKNIFINHFLASYQSAGNGANITRTGIWGSTSYPASTIGGKSVSLGAYTTAVDAYIEYTFTGDNVVFTMIFGDGTTEVYTNSFEVYIDNVLQGTYSAKYGTDAVSDGADGNTRQPAGFIYTGLSFGTHTVKVKNKTTDYMIMDYFGHLVDLNNAYPFVIFHAPKMDATGYATSPANATNAIIDSLNAKIDSLVATFPSGYPVYVARTNDFYTNTTASGDLDVADHIHPTNQGHRHIYEAAVDVYSSFPTVTGTARRVFWSNDRPYVFDDNNELRGLSYADESANVAGSNKQVQYNNAGLMGGATGFEVGNTNNRVLIEGQAITDKILITKGASGQSADHYQWLSSTGVILGKIDAGGGMQILGSLTSPGGTGGFELEYFSGAGYITSYNRIGNTWQPINIRGSTTTIKSSNVDKVTVAGSRISLLDSVYLTNAVPYNSGAGIVHLGIDTVAASPTFGKLVRQTATGSTPTLDQVTTAGNTTTNSITVANVSWKGGTGSTLGQNGATSVGPESYGTLQLGSTANANQGIVYTDVLSGTRTYKLPNTSGTIALVETVKAMTKSKGVTLESPTSAENFGLWQTQVDITVTSINAVVIGSSPSVTINIAFGSDITSLTNVFSSGTAITNTTTGQTINSGFNDATIPAGSWIRLTSSATSGTITQIEVTINYTED